MLIDYWSINLLSDDIQEGGEGESLLHAWVEVREREREEGRTWRLGKENGRRGGMGNRKEMEGEGREGRNGKVSEIGREVGNKLCIYIYNLKP